MITTIKCDGCKKPLSKASGGGLDLCGTCAAANKTLSDKVQSLLLQFTKRYGTIKTINAMNILFNLMEKKLNTPPPIPKDS